MDEKDKKNQFDEFNDDQDNNMTDHELGESNDENSELNAYEAKASEMTDKYLRLSAEFDNYRKRTLKERSDLVKTAGEDVIKGLLPVVDDFERALDAMKNIKDEIGMLEGVELIYDKLMKYLQQKGLTKIDAQGQDFNLDYHEAVTKIAVPDAKMKNKVVDVIQNGYMLNDKVIRYAKVVIGE